MKTKSAVLFFFFALFGYLALAQTSDLLVRENLMAWEIAHKDESKKDAEGRAKMLKDLGLNQYAYITGAHPIYQKWNTNDSQLDIDAEIVAMQQQGITIKAWYFWLNVDDPLDDPNVLRTLEAFKKHRISPQIWVADSNGYRPKNQNEWNQYLPAGVVPPTTLKEYRNLPKEIKKQYDETLRRLQEEQFPKTPKEEESRIEKEAERIRAFAELAAPYDCKVNLYNHRGWFGMIKNQLLILERLKKKGINDVGLVYNFSHSRFGEYDDTKEFENNWKKIMAHVVAVNITGLTNDGRLVYPSQGDIELEMIRIIQDSGWSGPVGIFIPGRGDIEVMLKKTLIGTDWMQAELSQEGSSTSPPKL